MSTKATMKFCGEQILRLDGLTGYASMGADGFRERAVALLEAAGTQDIAEAAIDALLGDTARASNPETNRLPSAGEIRLWVEAVQPQERYAEGGAAIRGGCGTVFRKLTHPDGGPARCEDTWVRSVRNVGAKGTTAVVPVESIGKCPRCCPGWYSGG